LHATAQGKTAMPEEMSAGARAPAAETDQRERQRKKHWETLVEIVEVLVLAIVAVATSWSGYSAARRDGRESLVLFATVPFVVAIAQRFRVRAVRVTATAIALALAAYTTVEMLALPRA